MVGALNVVFAIFFLFQDKIHLLHHPFEIRPPPRRTSLPRMAAKEEAKKCVPCSSLDTSSLLPSDTVDQQLQELIIWKQQVTDDIPMLCWQFTAKNFQAALDAVNAMGKIAERENHHPDFHLTNYREVKVQLWTHKLNGITQNDMELAKLFSEEVKVLYSPKWLKEHPEAASTSSQD